MKKQLHTLIVPGVGGSDDQHWQSKLEQKLQNVTRVQQNWNAPILEQWIKNWINTVEKIKAPIQVIAHSFGCLTTLAALAKFPHLQTKIKKLILVAPANPTRFSKFGFSHGQHDNYSHYFKQLKVNVPSVLIASENDPWLSLQDAQMYAQHWQMPMHNLGRVGHINVASGFGHFPQLNQFLLKNSAIRKVQTPLYVHKTVNFLASRA